MTHPTLASSFADFVNSIAGILNNLLNAILAVFTSILALGQNLITTTIHLGESVVKLGLEVFQGAFGFVIANAVGIALLAGGYYIYTQRTQGPKPIGAKPAA